MFLHALEIEAWGGGGSSFFSFSIFPCIFVCVVCMHALAGRGSTCICRVMCAHASEGPRLVQESSIASYSASQSHLELMAKGSLARFLQGSLIFVF